MPTIEQRRSISFLEATLISLAVMVVTYLALISALTIALAAHRICLACPYCVARVRSGLAQTAIFVLGERLVMGGCGRVTITTDPITAEAIFLVATGDNQAHYGLVTTRGRVEVFEAFPGAYEELEERRWAHLLKG